MRYVDLGPLLLVGAVGGLVVMLVSLGPLRRGDLRTAARRVGRILLAVAILGVLTVTHVPLLAVPRSWSRMRSVNLVPLHEIAVELDNVNQSLGLVNVLGNVAMFVPLGLLAVPVLHWGVARTTLAGAVLSAGIEVAQYVVGRSADVDDLLLNTAGTVLGALLAVLLVRLATHFPWTTATSHG